MELSSTIPCSACTLFFMSMFIFSVGLEHLPCQIPRRDIRVLPPRTAPERSLQIPEGQSSFNIAIFADIHFGENAWTDWGMSQDDNSLKVMSSILDHESPDFIIYLGDVITANSIPIANASLFWNLAVSPATCHGIPWASVFGNHDDAPFEWPLEWFSVKGIPQVECSTKKSSYLGEEQCLFDGTTRLELMKNEIGHNISYSGNGPRYLWPSVSNYVLNVSAGNFQSPAMFMYFLDSGGGSYPEVISSAQARWFEGKSQEINPDSRVPEIVFWHIPSKHYEKVAPMFGINEACVGSINKEKVAAQEAEMGIMKLLVQRSSVKAVFVGHNHGLDWCCPYKKKLWLCFARHTGYGGYGNWSRGARIIQLTQLPFLLKSWIRMEDGFSHSEVVLSS